MIVCTCKVIMRLKAEQLAHLLIDLVDPGIKTGKTSVKQTNR